MFAVDARILSRTIAAFTIAWYSCCIVGVAVYHIIQLSTATEIPDDEYVKLPEVSLDLENREYVIRFPQSTLSVIDLLSRSIISICVSVLLLKATGDNVDLKTALLRARIWQFVMFVLFFQYIIYCAMYKVYVALFLSIVGQTFVFIVVGWFIADLKVKMDLPLLLAIAARK